MTGWCMRVWVTVAVAVVGIISGAVQAAFITVASTTSTEQSGFFKHVLPRFEKASGIQVRIVALGTGQALDLARRGDADVVLVHDPEAETKFVAEGHGLRRYAVMYNDFVLVGPRSDPAQAQLARDVVLAFQRIFDHGAPFVSRGDRSGTHAAELRLWQLAQRDPSRGRGAWYRETGSGMGPALNAAAAMNAYLLTDRGTWLSFRNRADLFIVVQGDQRLFNQYGVIVVNPEKHPHIKADAAQRFADWLISNEGQQAIASYKIDGEQLFFPYVR